MNSSADFSDVPLTLAANPFRPGMGIAPPHLVGREAEQGALLAGLEQLRSGQPVNGLVLSAPRGLGKTVLLRWLAGAAGPMEIALHNLNANQIPSVTALAEVLAPPKPPDAGLSLGLHAELAGASAGLEVSRTPAPPVAHTAHEHLVSLHLRELAKRSPLVVIVDEAHSLAPEVARAQGDFSQLSSGLRPAAEASAAQGVRAGSPASIRAPPAAKGWRGLQAISPSPAGEKKLFTFGNSAVLGCALSTGMQETFR